MISFKHILRDERILQVVLGVSTENFRQQAVEMDRLWQQSFERPGRRRAPGAGRKAVLVTAEDKLAFILFYLKVAPTFDLLGEFFGLDGSECCRWVHRLLPMLEEVLGQPQILPRQRMRAAGEFWAAFPQVREILQNSAERPVQHPKKNKPKPQVQN